MKSSDSEDIQGASKIQTMLCSQHDRTRLKQKDAQLGVSTFLETLHDLSITGTTETPALRGEIITVHVPLFLGTLSRIVNASSPISLHILGYFLRIILSAGIAADFRLPRPFGNCPIVVHSSRMTLPDGSCVQIGQPSFKPVGIGGFVYYVSIFMF